jgi:hypothetical protein
MFKKLLLCSLFTIYSFFALSQPKVRHTPENDMLFIEDKEETDNHQIYIHLLQRQHYYNKLYAVSGGTRCQVQPDEVKGTTYEEKVFDLGRNGKATLAQYSYPSGRNEILFKHLKNRVYTSIECNGVKASIMSGLCAKYIKEWAGITITKSMIKNTPQTTYREMVEDNAWFTHY